jgi:general secretion pathway protein A
MYQEHYGLVRSPFEMTPDPAFLVFTDSHREGLATLVYAVHARKGFVLLTGEGAPARPRCSTCCWRS